MRPKVLNTSVPTEETELIASVTLQERVCVCVYLCVGGGGGGLGETCGLSLRHVYVCVLNKP